MRIVSFLGSRIVMLPDLVPCTINRYGTLNLIVVSCEKMGSDKNTAAVKFTTLTMKLLLMKLMIRYCLIDRLRLDLSA